MSRLIAFAVAVSLLSAPDLSAQGPTQAAARSALGSCTYETCAIRRERAMFGGSRVVTGRDGAWTSAGVLGGGLIFAVERVPAALAEAQHGRRDAIVAAVAGVIGTLALSASLQAATSADILTASDTQLWGGLLVGAAGLGVLSVKAASADNHFSRAVWLYNRELAR